MKLKDFKEGEKVSVLYYVNENIANTIDGTIERITDKAIVINGDTKRMIFVEDIESIQRIWERSLLVVI